MDLFNFRNFLSKLAVRLDNGGIRALLAGLVVAAFLAGLRSMAIGDRLESYLAHRVNFGLREKLGLQPAIDPTIKIFALDDPSVAYLGDPELGFNRWQKILTSIGQQQPRAIFIDKMFGRSKKEEGVSPEDLQSVRTNAPVFAGAFTFPTQILGRWIFPFEQIEANRIVNFIPEGKSKADVDAIPWLDQEKFFVYGPDVQYVQAFSGVGLIDYFRDGYIKPMRRKGPDHIIRHLGLLSSSVEIREQGLNVNGHLAEVDRQGRILANLIGDKKVFERTYSFRSLLEPVDKNRPIKLINAGDTVLLLPLMFTGNSDFYDTPAGVMPGGFILLSVINSALSGKWISTAQYEMLYIFAAAVIAALCASLLNLAVGFVLAIVVVPLALGSIGVGLFSYHGFLFPWLYPSSASILTGLYVFYRRSKQEEIRSRQLTLALGQAVPPAMLQEILKHPESLQMRPTSDIVTVMFIDIAGFSLTSETQDARSVFSGLKEFNGLVRKLVHDYGGVVDKALGDGVLAYFGHSLHRPKMPNSEFSNHAELALQCAVQIQKENIKRCLENAEQGKAVYPLRIGINTSNVYIGNLGDENKIEFTIVGDGVNYAKRLEEGCELFKVLLGQGTKQLLASSNQNAAHLEMRLLRIKHHDDSHREAFEFDPFLNDRVLLSQATQTYQKLAGFTRVSERWSVPEGLEIPVQFDRGTGLIKSFSDGGISLEADTYFARGVELSVTLDPKSKLWDMVASEKLFPILVQVRWGNKIGQKRYLHGVRISSLNREQKQILLKKFSDYVQSRNNKSD